MAGSDSHRLSGFYQRHLLGIEGNIHPQGGQVRDHKSGIVGRQVFSQGDVAFDNHAVDQGFQLKARQGLGALGHGEHIAGLDPVTGFCLYLDDLCRKAGRDMGHGLLVEFHLAGQRDLLANHTGFSSVDFTTKVP
nr:hypothetical protein [Haliea sp.]